MTTITGHPYTPIPDAFTTAMAPVTDVTPEPQPVGGSTIADELPLYAVHLQAENKSRATVSLWTGAARQLNAYLLAQGMPTDVRTIRREHLESRPSRSTFRTGRQATPVDHRAEHHAILCRALRTPIPPNRQKVRR